MTRAKRQAASPRRLGIFGGTFDPPHTGHLALAECAREQLGLDRVLFVPAGRPPHKSGAKRSSTAHRVAMTRAAVRGNPAFAVSTIETRRSGPSWTVDTLRALAAEHAGDELWLLMGVAMTRAAVRGNPAFAVSTIETRRRGPSWTVDTVRALAAEHAGEELWLLMGADSWAAFGTWREPAEIARHARLAVALRPGARAPKRPRGIARDRVTILENPELEISSSAVRERARAGRSVRYLVPDAVARHIARHRLYGSTS